MSEASSERPIRVLQLVPKMDRAGLETWLMHVLRNIDRERFHLDFLATDNGDGDYDDEIRSLGGRVFRMGYKPHRKPFRWSRDFRRFHGEHGPYDVVHSHLNLTSGWALRCAELEGVPVRIAHQHNDVTFATMAGWSPWRRLKFAYWRRLLRSAPTHGFGCSEDACENAFGANWRSDSRWSVLHCGIDMQAFHDIADGTRPADGAAIRESLGLPRNAIVLGHVGRFQRQKNHTKLLDIAAETMKREPRTRLLLVGAGPLRDEMERKARRLGIADRVIFAGVRSDVPELMESVIDVFVMPSLFEGIPVVVMEAQAAGLPCVLSDRVTEETDVASGMIRRCPLDAPLATWADAILSLADREGLPTKDEALRLIEASSFSILKGVERLQGVYEEARVRQETTDGDRPR